MAALIQRKDESYGSTEEVPRGASGAGDHGVTRDEAKRIAELQREVKELHRVGEQLGINRADQLLRREDQVTLDKGGRRRRSPGGDGRRAR